MNFRVEMTTQYAERILRHGAGGRFTIGYGEQGKDFAFHADQEGELEVINVQKVKGGNAGNVIEIDGWLTNASGRRQVRIHHSSAYGPKGMAIMREL
jgi:hypothetical protein